jgi:hypothetical protein
MDFPQYTATGCDPVTVTVWPMYYKDTDWDSMRQWVAYRITTAPEGTSVGIPCDPPRASVVGGSGWVDWGPWTGAPYDGLAPTSDPGWSYLQVNKGRDLRLRLTDGTGMTVFANVGIYAQP